MACRARISNERVKNESSWKNVYINNHMNLNKKKHPQAFKREKNSTFHGERQPSSNIFSRRIKAVATPALPFAVAMACKQSLQNYQFVGYCVYHRDWWIWSILPLPEYAYRYRVIKRYVEHYAWVSNRTSWIHLTPFSSAWRMRKLHRHKIQRPLANK